MIERCRSTGAKICETGKRRSLLFAAAFLNTQRIHCNDEATDEL
jgi:hypothetical protein